MPLIFLTENNSLSKKVLKFPFSLNPVSIFEIPLKKMRKRAIYAFRQRLISKDYLFLSEDSLSFLLPESKVCEESFFNSLALKILSDAVKAKGLYPCRLVILNPTKEKVISALNFFSDIALQGKDSLMVSNMVYRKTGASIPITSGFSLKDAVLCEKANLPKQYGFALGFDLTSDENTLGQDGLRFYPKGIYSDISSYIKRPLSLKEAAALTDYDKNASFNIAF